MNTRTRVPPDQKEGSKNRNKPKIKDITSPLPFLGQSIGLGMTRGTYDTRRSLLTCVTATFSADIPCVDAQPYRLVVKKSF